MDTHVYTHIHTHTRAHTHTHTHSLSLTLTMTLSFGISQAGLQKMTSDISKLVNLKALTLCHNTVLDEIPEAISCLQSLQSFYLHFTRICKVPAGLATLANLRSISITNTIFNEGPMQFPTCLTVRFLLHHDYFPLLYMDFVIARYLANVCGTLYMWVVLQCRILYIVPPEQHYLTGVYMLLFVFTISTLRLGYII
jgi:hypothetical protein